MSCIRSWLRRRNRETLRARSVLHAASHERRHIVSPSHRPRAAVLQRWGRVEEASLIFTWRWLRGLEDTGLYDDPGYIATVEAMGGGYRGRGAKGGDYDPYGGSGAAAGTPASGYRSSNTWNRERQHNASSPRATFDELERQRRCHLEREALVAKRESQHEQMATLAARIEEEKKAVARRVTLAAAAKRQRSSGDGEGGIDDTIGGPAEARESSRGLAGEREEVPRRGQGAPDGRLRVVGGGQGPRARLLGGAS